jgi:predicted dehydrogenase
MLKVGIVGFGFMGRMHYRCWDGMKGAKVAAVCDANPKILEQLGESTGNIEGAETNIDPSNFNFYTDFDEMLSKEQLDAVSITLPTNLHPDFSSKTLKAGLNVLCEKPMALTVSDCEKMISTAKESRQVLMIGHCLRFWPEYVKAKEIIDGGEYGKVVAAVFQRLGAAPSWSEDNWFLDECRSGGVTLDLHIHDTDYVHYLFGMPKAVLSNKATGAGGGTAHIVTQYLYDDGKLVSAEGGWSLMPSFGFEMSFNIMLEKATIVYDCTRKPALKVCTREGETLEPELEKDDGYVREMAYFVKLIKGEKVEEIITLEQSRDSVKIIEAEKKSAEKCEKVVL